MSRKSNPYGHRQMTVKQLDARTTHLHALRKDSFRESDREEALHEIRAIETEKKARVAMQEALVFRLRYGEPYRPLIKRKKEKKGPPPLANVVGVVRYIDVFETYVG